MPEPSKFNVWFHGLARNTFRQKKFRRATAHNQP
jgi:hypothetical protein